MGDVSQSRPELGFLVAADEGRLEADPAFRHGISKKLPEKRGQLTDFSE